MEVLAGPAPNTNTQVTTSAGQPTQNSNYTSYTKRSSDTVDRMCVYDWDIPGVKITDFKVKLSPKCNLGIFCKCTRDTLKIDRIFVFRSN